MTTRSIMVAAALSVCACGGSSSPLAPSTPAAAVLPFTGTWTGTTSDPVDGPGTFTASFTQSGELVSGTWSDAFAIGTAGGSVSATVNASTLTFDATGTATLRGGSCSDDIKGILSLSGTTLSGTYLAQSSCAPGATINGTIQLQQTGGS